MKPTQLEKLENLNELFTYAIDGAHTQLKNNELTTEGIDKLVGALLIVKEQYEALAAEARAEA